jgi:hypothetical protein
MDPIHRVKFIDDIQSDIYSDGQYLLYLNRNDHGHRVQQEQ